MRPRDSTDPTPAPGLFSRHLFSLAFPGLSPNSGHMLLPLPGMSFLALYLHNGWLFMSITCQVTLLHLKSVCPFTVCCSPHPLELLQPKASVWGERLNNKDICLWVLIGSCACTISPHEMMRGPRWQAQREGPCDLDSKPNNPNLNVAIGGGATSQESRSSGVQAESAGSPLVPDT